MTDRRGLTAREQAILGRLLHGAAFEGARELAHQIEGATVVGGLPTFLDLEPDAAVPAAAIPDGPIATRAFFASSGDAEIEVIIWIKDGRLSGLEYAWFGDEARSDAPDADRLRVD